MGLNVLGSVAAWSIDGEVYWRSSLDGQADFGSVGDCLEIESDGELPVIRGAVGA